MSEKETALSMPADSANRDAVAVDAVAFGHLICMAYKMSGQGLNPPMPADFPEDYEPIHNIIMNDYGSPQFYGFIARYKKSGEESYVIAIRGTMRISEWLINLQSMVAAAFYNYGQVGSGFLNTYKTIYLTPRDALAMGLERRTTLVDRRPFAEQVADAIETHFARVELSERVLSSPRVSIVGHSLGAALATLYAVERTVYGAMPIDKFYTFASPLVGDAAFAATFRNLNLSTHYRIADNWDPVPHLPPLSGFTAVGEEKKIDLASSYYYWNPLCSHPMDTYLNYFDPTHAPAVACRTLFIESESKLASSPAELGTPVIAKTTHGGATITVTITIQPGV